MVPSSDIGVSSSAYPGLLLPEALAQIAELSTAAEIRSFGLHTLLSKRNRAAALAAGLTYSVHGPFGYAGIGDVSEAERRAALDEQVRHIEASAAVGARVYVLHPDWRPEPGPRDPAVADALQRSFAELAVVQRGCGIELVVENMPGGGLSHFTHPGDLDLQGLGLILDVGHAAIAGCLDDWLADPRAPLRHVHLHDNHGAGDVGDPHLALGAGVIDAAAVLAVARAAGASVVLEHDEAVNVLASLAYLRSRDLIA